MTFIYKDENVDNKGNEFDDICYNYIFKFNIGIVIFKVLQNYYNSIIS